MKLINSKTQIGAYIIHVYETIEPAIPKVSERCEVSGSAGLDVVVPQGALRSVARQQTCRGERAHQSPAA